MIVSDLQAFCKSLIKGFPIIAVDYGTKKTGIAISNREHTFSMPFKTIENINDNDKISQIVSLIKTYSCCGIVIGLPIGMNGDFTKQTEIVNAFASKLSKLTHYSIYLQDERLTSKAANNLLKSSGMRRKERNAIDDSIAANIILQDTLSSMMKI